MDDKIQQSRLSSGWWYRPPQTFIPSVGAPPDQNLTIQGIEYRYPITTDILGIPHDLVHGINMHNHPSEFLVLRAAAQYVSITVETVRTSNDSNNNNYKWFITSPQNMNWLIANQFMSAFARWGTAPPSRGFA